MIPVPSGVRVISPEDAGEMADLRTFTRELMADAARDLGTRLDWLGAPTICASPTWR